MKMAVLLGEVKNLIKKIHRVSNGQAKIVEIGEFMNFIQVEISPNDGLYKGGKFLFKIRVDPHQLKTQAPAVICLTPIYHPNIDTSDLEEMEKSDEEFDSNVCLNMLDDWQPSYGLDGLINGLLFFFYHPEIEDSLSPYIGPGLSPEEFEENVQRSLLGMEVDGIFFDRNLDDDEYNVLHSKYGECSNNSETNIIINTENTKDVSQKDSVPNSEAPEVASDALTDCEIVTTPYRDVLETECEIKDDLPNKVSNMTTESMQIIKITDENLARMKLFDRSIPECDILFVVVEKFVRRFFCLGSKS